MWNEAKIQLLKMSAKLKQKTYDVNPSAPQKDIEKPAEISMILKDWKGRKEIILDTAGKILTWNTYFESILFYKASEIRGQSLSIIFSPFELSEQIDKRLLGIAGVLGCAGHVSDFRRKDISLFYGCLKLVALKKEKSVLGFSALCSEIPDC